MAAVKYAKGMHLDFVANQKYLHIFNRGLKMKVLMVTPYYYPPVIGGTESFIQSASLKLNERGISTDILTFSTNAMGLPSARKIVTQEMDNSRVIRIQCCNGIRPLKLVQVGMIPGPFQSFMKDYDIIHYHNETDLSLPLFSYFVKKPKIMHCHCINVSYRFYKKNPASRQLFKKISNLYIAFSNSSERMLIDLGIAQSNIRIVPNGVDAETFQPSKETKAENLLLFAGRICPSKGLHILLKSLEYIKTPVELVIIGPPLSDFSEYYTEILKLSKHMNEKTCHKVSFLGVQTKEELVRWYQQATIFVCPSLSDVFPLVNIEALSCGTPVIASNVGGIPEVVKNYKNGILVPAGVPIELAKAIQSLLDDEKLRNNFGREGREWVVKNFSSEAVAVHLHKIYNSLLTSHET